MCVNQLAYFYCNRAHSSTDNTTGGLTDFGKVSATKEFYNSTCVVSIRTIVYSLYGLDLITVIRIILLDAYTV